jgi:hypothetical protein
VNHLLLNVIADGTPQHHGPDFGKASPVGLLVIVLLVIATLFLVRSMNRQLRKVPKSFDRENPEPDQAADEGTDTVDEVGEGGPGTHRNGPARPPGADDEPG